MGRELLVHSWEVWRSQRASCKGTGLPPLGVASMQSQLNPVWGVGINTTFFERRASRLYDSSARLAPGTVTSGVA